MPTGCCHPSARGCAKRDLVAEWGGPALVLMSPASDLIIEPGGTMQVETIEACDEDAAWGRWSVGTNTTRTESGV